MLAKPQPPRIQLPRDWEGCVKLAVLYAIALAHYAIVTARAWAADSINARVRLAAENDRLHGECALLETCNRCGGAVRVIVGTPHRCIEEQDIIDRILAHLRRKEQDSPARPLLLPRACYHASAPGRLPPPTRAPPATLRLFSGIDSASTQFDQQGRQRMVTGAR